MSFVDIPNTTKQVRSIIYDIFATYNIILLDRRRYPMLERIQNEYKYLEIPELDDEELKSKLSSSFKLKWNVSLEDVLKECSEDNIFPDIVTKLKAL